MWSWWLFHWWHEALLWHLQSNTFKAIDTGLLKHSSLVLRLFLFDSGLKFCFQNKTELWSSQIKLWGGFITKSRKLLCPQCTSLTYEILQNEQKLKWGDEDAGGRRNTFKLSITVYFRFNLDFFFLLALVHTKHARGYQNVFISSFVQLWRCHVEPRYNK